MKDCGEIFVLKFNLSGILEAAWTIVRNGEPSSYSLLTLIENIVAVRPEPYENIPILLPERDSGVDLQNNVDKEINLQQLSKISQKNIKNLF